MSEDDDSRHAANRKIERLLEENPGYVSGAYVARRLGLSRMAVRRYDNRLQCKKVEGYLLYHNESVERFAISYKRLTSHTIKFRGIEVDYMMKICAVYYRTQYDAAPKELLRLAKKVAKL